MKQLLVILVIFSLIWIGAYGPSAAQEASLIVGESQQVFGRAVSTWARVAGSTVTEVGVTVPFLVILRAPFLDFRGGSGPSGAVAVLDFPAVVQRTTFTNTFVLHWNPMGHEPPGIFTVPHWDLHFYAISAAEVKQVSPANSLPRPAANRVPAGYALPPNDQAYIQIVVPEMGAHAGRATVFQPGYRFTSPEMILGYHRGQLTFIEPMITREWLLGKQSLTMDIPRPQVVGRATRYPTKFTVVFDADANTYEFILSDFVPVE